MFNTILGIPAHPLLIHAAVVFIPLLIVGAIVYAAIPQFRSRIDWAVLALAIIAPLCALFAKLSGQDLKQLIIDKHLASPQLLQKITRHNSYGNDTFWWTLGLGIVTLALFAYQFPRDRRAAAASRPRTATIDRGSVVSAVVRVVSTVVMLVLGIVVGYYVFRTGDTGAHIVWAGVRRERRTAQKTSRPQMTNSSISAIAPVIMPTP